MRCGKSWGIAGTDSGDEEAYKMVKDGKVVGTVNTDEFRSFLEFSQSDDRGRAAGYGSFSQPPEQYHAKLNEGGRLLLYLDSQWGHRRCRSRRLCACGRNKNRGRTRLQEDRCTG